MYIRCQKGLNDDRYFVNATIESLFLTDTLEIDFLIDTGACNTVIDGHVARKWLNVIDGNYIHEAGTSRGIGHGDVRTFEIHFVDIVFTSLENKKHKEKLDTLCILSDKTIDDNQLPPGDNMLGIDILKRFQIKFEGDFAYLIK